MFTCSIYTVEFKRKGFLGRFFTHSFEVGIREDFPVSTDTFLAVLKKYGPKYKSTTIVDVTYTGQNSVVILRSIPDLSGTSEIPCSHVIFDV